MLKIVALVDTTLPFKNAIFLNRQYSSIKYVKFVDHKEIGHYPRYTSCVVKAMCHPDIGPDEIGMCNFVRAYCGFALGETVNIIPYNIDNVPIVDKITFVANSIRKVVLNKIYIDDESIVDIKKSLVDIPIISNFEYASIVTYDTRDYSIKLRLSDDYNTPILINENTEVTIVAADPIVVKSSSSNTIFKSNFNFQEMGIGGLDDKFEIIFRRAFASRTIPEKMVKEMGINHVRGMIFYGPPGTGKTLIARKIGKVLNCVEPKIVNGPSLINKYVGQSEENVRNLFADAIADKSNNLHLIICDEFDALAKKRGSSSDSGVGDKIVNQFLTMIDGPEPLNNILLICMTNRIDLIDEAMLRPGRLEIQVQITLPSASGRLEILNIHTKQMSSNGYLDSNVHLDELVSLTNNFTGAEIEAVIKNAVSFSLSREVDPSNLILAKNIKPIVTQSDLLRSVGEINPQFGSRSDILDIITSNPLQMYSDEFNGVYQDISKKLNGLRTGYKVSFLICGNNGIGKTKLAAHLSKESGYNCVKFINSETLVGQNSKDGYLHSIIEEGMKSESTIFILDSLEKLISYSGCKGMAVTYDNKTLHMILMLLDKVVSSGNKIGIIITSSKPDMCSGFGITENVDYDYEMSNYDIAKRFKALKLSM